jgi:2',3'-cyclic-nucleotide 2'-phosphodiesterase (5'-nucleotidase family)
MKFSSLFFLAAGFMLTASSMAEARLLHIIHTNDLHSYFKGYKDGSGGYARVKTKIAELRQESLEKGIEVLQLDGGDFGEGSSFFLADEGAASIKALGMMEVDVAVIGNHDHMLGGKILSQQIKRAGVHTRFISANLVQTPEMELGGLVTPYVDVEKNGIAIRIIGLSTAEPHFQYPLLPGFIAPPIAVGDAQANIARKEGKELIIALTHIGLSVDELLARRTSEIDLIVGGHSHTRLDEVVWVRNKKNKQVPIVQAGAHGLVVGSLLINVQGPGQFEIVDYKLHRIKEGLVESDQTMANFVMAAAEDRNQYFGGRWAEIIGETLIPLSGYKNGSSGGKASCWGRHMAKMTRDAADADIGIHLANFEGTHLDPGTITFGDMIDNYPHFSNYGDNGWEISTVKLKGYVLKTIIRAIINVEHQMGVNFHGISYRSILLPKIIPYLGGRRWAFNMRVNGFKIQNNQDYVMAFPTEVAHALRLSLPQVTQKLFPSLDNTGKYYWTIMEDYIRENSPIQCL